jgi:hypothetical protein
MPLRLFVLVAMATALVSESTSAQAPSTSTAAALLLTEGVVYVNDTSIAANGAASVLPEVVVVRTTRGRAAVALKRGGVLLVDVDSAVRVLANSDYNFNRLEVLSGSAIVASRGSAPLVDCESAIRLSSPGLFRFDAQAADPKGERPCLFRVYDGAAAVPLVTVTMALRPGQSIMCNRRCGDMIPTDDFSPSDIDEFDHWARRVQERFRH